MGTKPKTCYQACVQPVGTEEISRTEWVQPEVVSTYEQCQYDMDGRAYDCETIEVYSSQNPCRDRTLERLAEYPEEFRGNIQYNFYVFNENGGECHYVFYNAPVLETVYNDSRCPSYNCPVPRYGTCRHPGFGEAPATAACGSAAGPVYSTPGKSVNELKSATDVQTAWRDLLKLNSAEPTPPVAFASTRCLTCEDKPLDIASSQEQAQQLYACLEGTLGSQNGVTALPAGAPLTGVARPALANQLVERLKLLFERKGALLSQAQQERILRLYNIDPFKSVRLNCPLPFTPPQVTEACGGLSGLNQQLGFCSLLEPAHVSRPVRDSYLAQCLDLASPVVNVPMTSACLGADYRDTFFALMESLVTRQLTPLALDIPTTDTDEPAVNPEQLHYALKAMDTWYVRLRTNLSSSPSLFTDRVKSRLPAFMGTFWDTAYATRVPLDTTIPTLPAQQLTDYLDNYLGNVANLSMAVERDVLRAALPVSGAPPMTSSALVLVMGDAFTGLTRRLESLRPFHDLGCRFKRCKLTDTSQMSQLWALLANLDDATQLEAKVKDADRVGDDWRQVFRQIQQNHATVANAVRDSLLEDPARASRVDSWKELLSSGLPESMSAGMVPLSKHIQLALARSRSRDKIGLFEPTLQNRLYKGIQESQQGETISRIEADNASLKSRLDSYSGSRRDLASSLQKEIQNRSGQSRLLAEIQRKVSDLEELSRNQAALRQGIEVQQARFALFIQMLNQQLKREAGDSTVAYDRVSRTLTNVTADNARQDTSNGKTGVESVSFYKWPGTGAGDSDPALHINKGDIVNINATGSWSPTCAMYTTRQKPFDSGGITVTDQSGKGITTGPEGFVVSLEGSSFKARANERVNQNGSFYTNVGSHSECAGVQVQITTSVALEVVSSNAYARIEDCNRYDHGRNGSTSNSTSGTTGSESRETATFHRGLRLPNTPFPSMPVGSLLAVVMKRGAIELKRDSILDIHVVQSPFTSFVVQDDADVYLVVNDKAGCAVDTTVGLLVQMTRVRPLGSVVTQVADQMSATLLDIRSKTDNFLASGRLLPADKALLRSKAMLQLGGLRAFPELMNIYEAWLDTELAVLEKQVESNAVKLSMERLALEIRALNEQLQLANAEARMVRKTSMWALREMDADTLSSFSLLVLNKAIDQLYPIADLRQPSVFGTLEGTAYKTQLEALVQIKVDDTLRLQVKAVHDVVESLVNLLKDARSNAPSRVPIQLALRFPRPTLAQYHSRQPSNLHTVDAERSAALWAAVDSRTRASLTLLPSDLYGGRSPGASMLGCNEAAPVIESMGIHFVWPNPLANQYNNEDIRLNVEFDRTLTFPREDGPVSYSMVNQDWTNFNVRTSYYGSIANAGSTFNSVAAPTLVGNGLSPFTRLSIDFGLPVMSNMWEADDIILFFKVSPRTAQAGGLSWLEVCQQP